MDNNNIDFQSFMTQTDPDNQQRYSNNNQSIEEASKKLIENPFNTDRYNNINVPDQPINYGGGMAEQLLNDNEVPEDLRKKYWWVLHKDNVLTFLDEGRKASKMMDFDITKIDIQNTTPYYDYDFDLELEMGIMRNKLDTKLDRALGFKGTNVKNERIVLQSQFSENRQISEMGNDNGIKEGFLKRLMGRRN